MEPRDQRNQIQWLAISVFLLSVFVISYQIGLMKALTFVSYTHFVNLIISVALLGFGASGTLLVFLRLSSRRAVDRTVTIFFLLLVLSVPLSYLGAVNLNLDVQYLFYSDRETLLFLLYAFLLFLPFFFAAALIGLSFAIFLERVPELYGGNLFGSGFGGIIVILLLLILHPAELPLRLTILIPAAAFFWFLGSGKPRLYQVLLLVGGVLFSLFWLYYSPPIEPDQYKTISHIRRLEEEEKAKELYSTSGPSGTVSLFSSSSFHTAFFANPGKGTTPPEEYMLLKNGESIGYIFKTTSLSETEIMTETPQSIPYQIHKSPKRVLILGETGGSNIWLALHYGAESITVVQKDPAVVEIWKEVLPDFGVDIFLHRKVRGIQQDPRLFLKQNKEEWDIIHLAGSEGMPAFQPGLYASREDFLLTVEGIRDCHRHLAPGGYITHSRGMQNPPRDNIKVLGLFHEVLIQAGIERGENHILQSKNYLAVNTVLSKDTLSPAMIDRYKHTLESLGMDSEWHRGIDSEEITQRHRVPGPEGKPYSYFHQAAKEIMTDNSEEFFHSYVYEVTPPTDDTPYFAHFFRWRSAGKIIDTYGVRWFRSSEVGYLLLFITFLGVGLFGLIFILLPLLMRYRGRGLLGRLPLFLFIGVGFMFVEIVTIHKLGIFLGDPVYSASAVITSILVFSGIGSVLQGKLKAAPGKRICLASICTVVFLFASLFLFSPLISLGAGWQLALRYTAAVLFIAPFSFFMGWFFASGIQSLRQAREQAVPLAWGINGFSSVAASPLATILSMEFGFTLVMLTAIGLYILAGLLPLLWGDGFSSSK